MNTNFKNIKVLAAAVTLGISALSGSALAETPGSTTRILTANFEPRDVVQVEVGDFHFVPGQVAPIHTHVAPAVGYVAKGEIIYQVEGEKQQILRQGDAFYEPAGPRILRFDNASATEEAIFLDFNLEQINEPFIVFENPPTEAIDRRSLPTVDLAGEKVDQVEIYASELKAGGRLQINNQQPTLGLVSEGVIELQIKGQPTQRIAAGGSFSLPTAESRATLVNVSSEVSAEVITFRLQ
jgi:quercetin dioxygenase-like cupin family protein